MKYFKKSMGISHIDGDWKMTWDGGTNEVWVRDLYWWERILFWKFRDKSFKKG